MKFTMDFLKRKRPEKRPTALQAEHLRMGVKPIIAGIYENGDIGEENDIDEETKQVFREIEKDGEFVNYQEMDLSSLEEKNIKNKGPQTYVISDCNEKAKYSKEYHCCTGVVLTGTDKISGKRISFLSHQDPYKFLEDPEVQRKLTADLSESISNILARSEPRSVDAVIFGGNTNKRMRQYKDSIQIINEICFKLLGFEPVVLTGPNLNDAPDEKHGTTTYFDTKNSRLYIVRPKQPTLSVNKNYSPSDIKRESKNWQF